MGEAPRLATEIDRLSIWAGEAALGDIEDVEALTTDTSERACFGRWRISIAACDVEAAVVNADALLDQGEAVTPLVYGMASRLRSAQVHQAAVMLAAGTPAQKVEAALPMAPYPSKMLVRSVSGVDPSALADAIGALPTSNGGRAVAPTTTRRSR